MDSQLRENIEDAVKVVIRDAALTGSRPQDRCYVRVLPDGSVDVSNETGYSISAREYFKEIPHTLSLEIPQGTRDYTHVSECDPEEDAQQAADELLAAWESKIEEWIEAGNRGED